MPDPGATLTPAPSLTRVRFRSAKRPKALVSPAPYQRFETESNGVGIGLRPRDRLRVAQQVLIDIQGLFHPYDYAISIWLYAQ